MSDPGAEEDEILTSIRRPLSADPRAADPDEGRKTGAGDDRLMLTADLRVPVGEEGDGEEGFGEEDDNEEGGGEEGGGEEGGGAGASPASGTEALDDDGWPGSDTDEAGTAGGEDRDRTVGDPDGPLELDTLIASFGEADAAEMAPDATDAMTQEDLGGVLVLENDTDIERLLGDGGDAARAGPAGAGARSQSLRPPAEPGHREAQSDRVGRSDQDPGPDDDPERDAGRIVDVLPESGTSGSDTARDIAARQAERDRELASAGVHGPVSERPRFPRGNEAPDRAAPGDEGAGSPLDEEMLRDMVAEIVRDELQGPLGERITRNVRKLVRREIMRAISVRDYE